MMLAVAAAAATASVCRSRNNTRKWLTIVEIVNECARSSRNVVYDIESRYRWPQIDVELLFAECTGQIDQMCVLHKHISYFCLCYLSAHFECGRSDRPRSTLFFYFYICISMDIGHLRAFNRFSSIGQWMAILVFLRFLSRICCRMAKSNEKKKKERTGDTAECAKWLFVAGAMAISPRPCCTENCVYVYGISPLSIDM